MKLLLTSSGISNPSIEHALVDLLGKPIADSSALIVPTAIYPFPDGPGGAWRAISGQTESPFSGLGWNSLGVLELTALPTIKQASVTTPAGCDLKRRRHTCPLRPGVKVSEGRRASSELSSPRHGGETERPQPELFMRHAPRT